MTKFHPKTIVNQTVPHLGYCVQKQKKENDQREEAIARDT